MKNNEDQHEKDWKEPPSPPRLPQEWQWAERREFTLMHRRWPGGGIGRGRHDKREFWAPPWPDFSKHLPFHQLRGKH